MSAQEWAIRLANGELLTRSNDGEDPFGPRAMSVATFATRMDALRVVRGNLGSLGEARRRGVRVVKLRAKRARSGRTP